MLENLRGALDAKGISLNACAAVLGVSQKTLWNKINEVTPISYSEARAIRNDLLPEYDMEWLFRTDGIMDDERREEAKNG